MSEAVVDDIVAVLPPLLQSLEALGFIARHLNPPDFDSVMEAAGSPDQALRAVRSRLADWPEQFASVRNSLEAASDAALKTHDVRWHWVKGHAGHDDNERADQLARDGIAMARLKQ